MSRKDDEFAYKLALDYRSLTDYRDKCRREQYPSLYKEPDNSLPDVELSFEEYRRLSKKERDDFRHRRGMFSRDPEKREMGEAEHKDHLVWDFARIIAMSGLLTIVLTDWEELIPAALAITVVVFVLGQIFAGEMWYK